MKKHAESHFDHGLTEAQVDFLLKHFADKAGFFIETITLPAKLGTVPCGLYGPEMGDSAIGDDEVTYAARGTRTWSSRLIDLPARQQHQVTVIAGPHEEECPRCSAAAGAWNLLHRGACPDCNGTQKIKHACIVYTMFGGPLAPQEPGDPGCKDPAASTAFWREHALSK